MGIKAEDLRRGNLLNFDSRIVKVSVIGSDYLGVKDGHKISSLDYSWLKPIPLTEEWLIKFPKDLDWLNKDEFGYYTLIKTKKVYIKFVHSLQNMYYCIHEKDAILK